MKIPFSIFVFLIILGNLQSSDSAPAADDEIAAKIADLAADKSADPDAESWIAVGNAKMQEARDKLEHDFSEAEAAYKKALGLKPDSTEAMLGMAWVKNSEHLFEQGRGWAEKALAINPELVDAHSLLGDYALERGDYDEAYDHYQAAIDLRGDLSTYSRASYLLWQTGDSTQAGLLMEKAIAAGGPYPENTAWCRVELATMQFNLGSILAAEMQAKKAMEAAPENPRVLGLMGKLSAAKEKYPEAIAFYEKSVAITPNHQSLAALVDLYKLTGNTTEENKAVEKLIAFHSPADEGAATENPAHGHIHTDGQASAELAMFFADHDQNLEKAVKDAEKAYETYKNIKVEDTLAWCYYKTGDYKKARRFTERAMKWNTKDPAMYYHRGMIHHKLGDKARAREYLNQALALNPRFDPIQAAIASQTLEEISLQDRSGKQKK
ncbi:MAG: tetratricopeptide repeat protein [Armatimonadetes bacterium]|nr:tetratricopeptide repeat protein [Akkermansiaceae bacterium]